MKETLAYIKQFAMRSPDVNVLQDRLIGAALDPQTSFTVPSIVRWRPVSNLVARLVAFSIRPEHVKDEARQRPQRSLVGTWIAGTIIVLALSWVIRRLTRRS